MILCQHIQVYSSFYCQIILGLNMDKSQQKGLCTESLPSSFLLLPSVLLHFLLNVTQNHLTNQANNIVNFYLSTIENIYREKYIVNMKTLEKCTVNIQCHDHYLHVYKLCTQINMFWIFFYIIMAIHSNTQNILYNNFSIDIKHLIWVSVWTQQHILNYKSQRTPSFT